MTDSNETGKANGAAKSLEDEEIIELTDEVINASEEEIIELTDVVEQPSLTDEAVEAEDEKEIVELSDETIDDTDKEKKTIPVLDDDSLETSLGLDEEFDEEPNEKQSIEDDFIGSLGMELEPETDISEEIYEKEEQLESEDTLKKDLVPETVSLSSEQIDEALERVINRMYSKKIESMLAEIIEKAVTKELERIKGTLIDDAVDES